MKPKYVKPMISSLPLANAAADDFELLGICWNGFNVGITGIGGCEKGSSPQSSAGCNTGSGDTADIRGCYGGLNPKDGYPPT